jgi:hypothetical protein
MPDPAIAPLPYRPAYEQPEKDEAETTQELIETLRGIAETTLKDTGHALRGVHAKSHGLLHGQFTVAPNLPATLAQGVYATPATYPVILRFSTNPGDLLDDSISVPRGLAIKVMGVPGERLPDAAGDSQDYVIVNGPAFVAPNARKFLGNLKLLAKTTDTPQMLKKVVSATLRGAENVLESLGGESALLKNMGGHPNTHILGETFYTQVPLLHGPYMAKLSIAPATPALQALHDQHIHTSGRPDALREELSDFISREGGEWEVRVQLCTDLDSMPIEDASAIWPEDASPYITVARITVKPQSGWTEDRARLVDEGLSFSPWHGLAAHRPLGSIMRVRKATYEASVAFRSSHGRCPVHEPRGDLPLPG